jgi:phage virion morphogenesis protein
MSLVITPNKQQALSLKNQLLILSMPANKRTRILKTLGRYERQLARKRIRSQTTVDGNKFAARADGRKAKMLKRMGKKIEPYVKNANRLELKHKAALTGRIAALHQFGGVEKMSASRLDRQRGGLKHEDPCTEEQARSLAKEGYKVRRGKGKKYRRASINEILASMTMGQAGLILRTMRGGSRSTNKTWNIPVSPRPFLGDSTENVQRELVNIIEKVNSNSKRG